MESIKVNMTPLVDVCMSLLIVFMVSGSFLIQPNLKIEIPEAATNEEKEEQDKIILYVSKEGQIAIDELIVNRDDVETLIKKKLDLIKSDMILIKIDKNSRHANLLDIMEIAKKSGAAKITIATEQKK